MTTLRFIAAAFATVTALAGSAVSAAAQDYPTRPITLTVPFAAGGPPTSSPVSSATTCRRRWARRS